MKVGCCMAKKSRQMASGVRGKTGRGASAAGTRGKALFTAAERRLLAESDGVALEKASRAVVHDRLKRVRGLRDKWRDLFGSQTRAEKRSPQAVAQANARSRAKAEELQGAVARLERRLAELQGGATATAATRRPVKKASRTAAHRTTRAGVRAALAEKTAVLNQGRQARPAAARVEPPAAVPAKPTAATAASPAAVGGRRRVRSPVVAAVAGTPQAIRFDRAQQRAARAGAKRARLAVKGVSTRRGGHVLASGKRAQARRDKRPR